jgi:hypothetical protein
VHRDRFLRGVEVLALQVLDRPEPVDDATIRRCIGFMCRASSAGAAPSVEMFEKVMK